jgi:hypothetical protein
MSMSPITQTIQGQSMTFLLTSAALNSTLDSNALNWAFWPQQETASEWGGGEPTFTPTQTQWAVTLAASDPAACSQIPPAQIKAVLQAALVGGGMDDATATDTAERIVRNQLNRSVDYLAAQVVQAAIAG